MAKKNSKWSKFWSSVSLKLSLLRVWFFKNIKIFLMWAVIIYAVLVLTGNAAGGLLFGDLSESIANITSSSTIGDIIMNIIAVILSLGSGVLLVWKKSSNITLSDIKSKKLKKAMIAAGLYFNANGKLTKRVEHSLKADIDGDGKINDTPIEEVDKTNSTGLIRGTIDAVQELGTIFSTKIETKEDYSKVMTPELEEMKEVIEETDRAALPEQTEIQDVVINDIVDNTITIGTTEEKKAKKNIFSAILSLFKVKRKTTSEMVEELPDSDEEIVEPEEDVSKVDESIEVVVNKETAVIPETVKSTHDVGTVIQLTEEEKKKRVQEANKKAILDKLNSLYGSK